MLNRMVITLPLFAIGFSLTLNDSQRDLALLRLFQPDPRDDRALGGGDVPVVNKKFFLIAAAPATFMTAGPSPTNWSPRKASDGTPPSPTPSASAPPSPPSPGS
jgi:hypothetical protein